MRRGAPGSGCQRSTFAEKMKVNPIIALGCLALGAIIVFLILSILQREPESISISILDGTGLEGAEILNAAYELSSELSVEIKFRTTDSTSCSITAMSRRMISNLPVDRMSLELRSEDIRMNDEVLLEDELRSRLLVYAESGRLTESEPIILVAAHAETTGVRLVTLFQILCDSGLSQIIPTYTTEAANKAARATIGGVGVASVFHDPSSAPEVARP